METTVYTFTERLANRIKYLESLLDTNKIKYELDPSLDKFLSNVEKMKNPSKDLNKELLERYSRQMLIPEICLQGQEKIQKARVLLIGAGGIGAPAAYYLAGAGVGNIGIIDGDVVEESNLHRQIAHSNAKIGINKAVSARSSILEFNPHINVKIYEENLTPDNACDIIKDWDIVLDASDNGLARYLTNDACILNKKILVSGSALRWEGQLTVLGKDDGPCYRCLYPECPKPHMMMSCGTGGVVGIIPGVIGLLEALEALKLIVGVEEIYNKKILLFDGYTGTFRKGKIRGRNPNCVVCGDNPTLKDPKTYDYKTFVGTAVPPPTLEKEKNIEWSELLDANKSNGLKGSLFLDVRPQEPFKIVNLSNKLDCTTINIPWADLKVLDKDEVSSKIDPKTPIFVSCRLGNDSRRATKYLLDLGFENVKNVVGGINTYIPKYEPNLPLI